MLSSRISKVILAIPDPFNRRDTQAAASSSSHETRAIKKSGKNV